MLHRGGALHTGHRAERVRQTHPGFRFRLLATDISTAMLAKAKRAVFTTEVVSPVPAELRRKYFMRSRDPHSNLQRVVPELRELVEFRRLNFMEALWLRGNGGCDLLPERDHLF